MSRILSIVGSIVTISYSLAIYLLISDGRISQLWSMPLNEVGDFLAGVFGPLAIFWLILGFLQQGKELQQSTKALEMQAKELNNSVQQQKELVEVTRQQVDAELAALHYERQKQDDLAQPNFVFMGNGASHNGAGFSKFNTRVKNTGGNIVHVSITSESDTKFSPEVIHSWETNQVQTIHWEYDKSCSKEHIDVSINYTNSIGRTNVKCYEIIINNEAQHPTAEIYEKS